MRGIVGLLMVAVGLGCDAFSVAVCVGLAGATARQKVRLAIGFGAFQFLMPVAGLAGGRLFGTFVGTVASYAGGGLLVALGVAMVWRTLVVGFHCPPLLHTSFWALVTASLGVSLDALAVGVGYGLGDRNIRIVPASVVIGIVAFLMTVAGVEAGGQVGRLVQRRAPLLGGAILVALGLMILLRGR